MSEVALRKAGIVMGLEVSRLARNSADRHRLIELCALTATLILDEDGIYDPAGFNDRLLLGLKGTMSEAELHILQAFLFVARRSICRAKVAAPLSAHTGAFPRQPSLGKTRHRDTDLNVRPRGGRY